MQISRYLIIALAISGCLSASADKLSPDTRLFLEQRSRQVAIKGVAPEEAPLMVFIGIEKELDPEELRIAGIEVQGVFDGVVTARVLPSALESLTGIEGVRYIQKGSPVRLLNDFGRQELHVDDVHKNTGNTLPQTYTGKGVVVGMIDTGLEYGHAAFMDSEGKELRIRRVWDQNDRGVNPPAGFTYGNELATEAQILAAATDSRSQFHGSHTTGTAAGGGRYNKTYYGMAPDADIVYVSFMSDGNTSVADGIKYIFDYADQMGMPCVINMSLGSHQGPHDGTSYLDRIIDSFTGPGHIIVGACGNEGENKMHVSKTFSENDRTMKTFVTFAANQYEKRQYLDIWGTPGSNLKVSMGVFNSLKGQEVDRSNAYDTGGDRKSTYYFTYLDEVGVDMDVFINGEINPDNGAPHVWVEAEVAQTGQGRMPGLIIEGDPGATVHVWNLGLNEFASNGKAGFTDGDNSCTVGEIGGTAKSIITVGSYDGRSRLPMQRKFYINMNDQDAFPYEQYNHSVFSSYGPTADGRVVPHVVAPGLPVVSCVNRYGISSQDLENNYSDFTLEPNGKKSYYIYSMGTSMSAPHVTGVIALMLQANPTLSPEQAREILQSTADTWESMGTVPNNAYGAGRPNALKAVQKALELSGGSGVAEIPVDNESTRVWASEGLIHVMTPAVGSILRLYSLTGALLEEVKIENAVTELDASKWGKAIVVAELGGQTSRKSFKLTL